MKLALVAPEGIVRFAGTEAAGLALAREMLIPDAGAAFVSATVHVAGLPPATMEGLQLRDAI